MFEQLLKALPGAATSPYALVAYVVVVAAWAVRVWRVTRVQSQGKEILEKYQDESKRNEALALLLRKAPPKGLPRKETLDWVRIEAGQESRSMLLAAYITTVVAAIIIIVVALVRMPGEMATAKVRLERLSDSSCAPLPSGAELVATIDRKRQRVKIANGCEAVVSWHTARGETAFALERAGDFQLANDKVHWLKPNTTVNLPVLQRGTKEPRLKVVLLPYVATDRQGRDERELLGRILQSKLNSLGALIAPRAPGAPLNRLRVVSEDHTALSAQQLHEKWFKEHLLEIASGIIFTRGGKLVARSQIYLGELADPPSLHLDLDLHEDQFGQVNDSHALALVYALAMDAEKIGQPPHVILAYLDQATQLCQQLPAGGPGMAALKRSVSSIVRRWNVEAASKCQ